MESPPYLFDQFACTRGVSKEGAKRALMMQGYAAEGRTLKESTKALGISERSARLLARRFMIDFTDYRPYAGREKKGLERPAPFVRPVEPAEGLPLFGDH